MFRALGFRTYCSDPAHTHFRLIWLSKEEEIENVQKHSTFKNRLTNH